MSKTTTVAYAKYVNESGDRSRHHLINWGLADQKSTNKHRNSVNANSERGKQNYRGDQRGNPEMHTSASTSRNESSKTKPARSGNSEERIITKSEKSRVDEFKGNAKSPGQSPRSRKAKIEDYYASKGLNYEIIRGKAQIGVGDTAPGSEATGLYYDSWTPPIGFTKADMPAFVSHPIKEEAVSPAIVIARRQMQDKAKMPKKNADINCEELLNKFKSIREKAKGNHQKQVSNEEEQGNVLEPAVPDGLDTTFPEDESLNDSFLVHFSQQVEEVDDESRDVRKRDINGINRNPQPFTSTSKAKAATPVPLSSTPLADVSVIKPFKDDTPKGTRSAHARSRHRSVTKSSGLDIFETSIVATQLIPAFEEHPRKLFKFEPSPIKTGDFDDDDEDAMFSQIDMPSVQKHNMVNDENMEMDSFLSPDILGEIDKLEEMGIQSSSMSSASSSTERTHKKDIRKTSTKTIQETPKTGSKSRLGGYNRVRK